LEDDDRGRGPNLPQRVTRHHSIAFLWLVKSGWFTAVA
jgi:hypothetical protein